MVKYLNMGRTVKIMHLVIWVVWALLVFTYYDNRSQVCFTSLLGKYISYRAFNWFELIFMFGGGWLLLLLLQGLNKYAAYIIFEAIFIGIVAIHLRIYFCR